MTDLASNPIYKRVVEGSRGPSLRNCLLISAGIAVTAGGGSLVALLLATPDAFFGNMSSLFIIPLFIVSILTIFAPLIPLAAMTFTANRISGLVSQEAHLLVRLSGIPTKAIARGYIEGERYNFRLWIAIGVGLLASQLAGFIYARYDYALLGIGPIPFFSVLATNLTWLVTVAAYYNILWPLCLTAGVWVGLRDAKFATQWAFLMALGVMVYLFIVMIAKVVVSIAEPLGYSFFLTSCAVYISLVVALPYIVLRVLRADCARLVSRYQP